MLTFLTVLHCVWSPLWQQITKTLTLLTMVVSDHLQPNGTDILVIMSNFKNIKERFISHLCYMSITN